MQIKWANYVGNTRFWGLYLETVETKVGVWKKFFSKLKIL